MNLNSYTENKNFNSFQVFINIAYLSILLSIQRDITTILNTFYVNEDL